MSRLFAAALLVALAIALPASPVVAQDDSDFVEEQSPRIFAKKYPTRPGPIIPPPPNDDIVLPRPDMTRENRLLQSISSQQQGGLDTAITSEDLDTGSVFSLPRGHGRATSPEQEARRSLKRLIRELG